MNDDSNPFQEKPDWKGKLKSALQKSKDDVTGFLTRKRDASPLAPDAGPETDGHTMTDMIKMAWNDRVKPRFAKKKKRADDGAFSPQGFPPPSGGFRWTGDRINVLAILLALVLIAWTGADLAAIFVDKMIPEAPMARGRGGGAPLADRNRPFSDYQAIIARNLFNSLGRIPGDQAPGVLEQDNDPVKTSLPFNLIGTVILRNELRSVATLEDKGENQVYPVRVDDEIPGKVKILSIEPYKVIFRNLSSGRKEYVDMPEEGNGPRISVGTMSSRRPTTGDGGIEQTAPNTFNIARVELDKHLSNINEVLTQARAIPHFENGQPAGFKLIQIVQGSVYEKLGLKNGDVLKAVNGDPVDAAKAFEMMGMLKTVNQLELTVQRDGRTSNMSYNFR